MCTEAPLFFPCVHGRCSARQKGRNKQKANPQKSGDAGDKRATRSKHANVLLDDRKSANLKKSHYDRDAVGLA